MPNVLEAARVARGSLPVIDVSGLSSQNIADRKAVAAQLRAACLDKGFFYIQHHGVPETLVEYVFKEAAAFFVDSRSISINVTLRHDISMLSEVKVSVGFGWGCR